jgi:hypothetical protein
MRLRQISRHLPGLAIVAGVLIAAPAAQASLAWDTASHNFGNQNVGTASAPKTFTLTAGCDAVDPITMTLCIVPPAGIHPFGSPTVTGDGFALGVPNTCSVGFMSTATLGSTQTCTSTVTFTPTSAGLKTGMLATPGPGGPDIALSGTGVTPTTPTTQTPAAGGVAGKKAKKCKKGKKKRGAAAAKKCKKKRK